MSVLPQDCEACEAAYSRIEKIERIARNAFPAPSLRAANQALDHIQAEAELLLEDFRGDWL